MNSVIPGSLSLLEAPSLAAGVWGHSGLIVLLGYLHEASPAPVPRGALHPDGATHGGGPGMPSTHCLWGKPEVLSGCREQLTAEVLV